MCDFSRRTKIAAGLLAMLTWVPNAWLQNAAAETNSYDVVVYGGTSAGVAAAVEASRSGKSVVIVSPDHHLGGLTSGGLGWTDTGNKQVIGGLARKFYHRVWEHYQTEDAWRFQSSDQYGNQGQGTKAIDGDERTMWIFEPHVAEGIFDEMVREAEIPLHRNEWLDRDKGVRMTNGRITEFATMSGKVFAGRVFIDATYEGDLMAAADVTYHVGREASDVYGERWNGVQVGVLHHKHHFTMDVSPFVIPGERQSGLLPGISSNPPGEYSQGDSRIQAYCFRMCLTKHEANRIPFRKPRGYDADQYELAARVLDAGWRELFNKFDPIPNHKTDTNNHGPFSTDYIGMNYGYPEASYAERRAIIGQHQDYQEGLMYFLANDDRVPADVRAAMSQWGLAADEFKDNGHWPHQLYIREARRMVGEYVMTENELLKRQPTPHSIGMGSYTMDSHNVQRYVKADGFVQNEGDIGVSTGGPYQIALGSVLPVRNECQNLLVPVCVSSSHIAFGSIRMEPVFMILGQSTAAIAALAIDQECAVQDVSYDDIRERLLEGGQVLEFTGSGQGILQTSLQGIVLDDEQSEKTGDWKTSASAGNWVGGGYLHESNAGSGCQVTFRTTVKATKFDVRVSYAAHQNRATNARVTLKCGTVIETVTVDQRKKPAIDGLFQSIGQFVLNGPVEITIDNENADGYVVVDAIQLLPVD
jgi:hypothetical protein